MRKTSLKIGTSLVVCSLFFVYGFGFMPVPSSFEAGGLVGEAHAPPARAVVGSFDRGGTGVTQFGCGLYIEWFTEFDGVTLRCPDGTTDQAYCDVRQCRARFWPPVWKCEPEFFDCNVLYCDDGTVIVQRTECDFVTSCIF